MNDKNFDSTILTVCWFIITRNRNGSLLLSQKFVKTMWLQLAALL